jgi:hypothetical protein
MPSAGEDTNEGHLHTAMGHELERLAAEARSGRAAATPLIVGTGAFEAARASLRGSQPRLTRP